MNLLDGKLVAENLKNQIKQQVIEIEKKLGRKIKSAIILVGENPASQVYVKNKIKSSEQVGIQTELIKLPENISQKQLEQIIEQLNSDKNLDGFIVQLPLPKHIDEQAIIEKISPDKDIDGFHPLNIGKLTLGIPTFIPATPLGIIEMLKFYKIKTEGKLCVIVGRSNIVGRPLSILLSQKSEYGNATVVLAHSKTQNLREITRQADILIAAIGKPKFITADMVKQNAVVIDVGINRIRSEQTKSGWKLVGDVDFEAVKQKAEYITPVPGGVGATTVAALLKNIVISAKRKL